MFNPNKKRFNKLYASEIINQIEKKDNIYNISPENKNKIIEIVNTILILIELMYDKSKIEIMKKIIDDNIIKFYNYQYLFDKIDKIFINKILIIVLNDMEKHYENIMACYKDINYKSKKYIDMDNVMSYFKYSKDYLNYKSEECKNITNIISYLKHIKDYIKCNITK